MKVKINHINMKMDKSIERILHKSYTLLKRKLRPPKDKVVQSDSNVTPVMHIQVDERQSKRCCGKHKDK